jgi:hypothetical protein
MDEVLIGRPLLQALGLDAAEHLSAVRDEYNNMDGCQIPSLTGAGKLTRLLLRYQEIEPKSLPASQVLEKSAQLDSVTYGELDADPEVPQLLYLKGCSRELAFSPDRLHNRPEAARYLLNLVTACSDRDTHKLSKFS